MVTWLPPIIEALVFLCSLVGVIVKFTGRIQALETKVETIEKEQSCTTNEVSNINTNFLEIKTALVRIETDIQWIKGIKENEQKAG